MIDVNLKIKETNIEIKKLLTEKTLSVSGSIEFLNKGFDKEGMSKKCSARDANDPNGKYYNMTPLQIIEAWESKAEESRRYGKLLDSYSDMVLNSLNESADMEEWKLDNSYEYDKRLNGLCSGFNQFYDNLMSKTDYKFVTREQQMFIKSNKSGKFINGRFDCLFYSESQDRYLLVDWKTNDEISKENKFAKLFGPLFDKDDCDLNKYSVQLYMYKKALSEVYKITTPDKIDCFICQFNKETNINGSNYTVHNLGFGYDSGLLDDIIDFVYKKKELQEKKH